MARQGRFASEVGLAPAKRSACVRELPEGDRVMRVVAWVVLSAALHGTIGWWIAASTFPDHEGVRAAAGALVPPEANAVSVWEISGLDQLVGPYTAYADFEDGAPDRARLVQVMQRRALDEGWALGARIDDPGAVDVPIHRGLISGTMNVFGPPSISNLGGRVRLAYAENVNWRTPLGALIGAVAGGILGFVLASRVRNLTRTFSKRQLMRRKGSC